MRFKLSKDGIGRHVVTSIKNYNISQKGQFGKNIVEINANKS